MSVTNTCNNLEYAQIQIIIHFTSTSFGHTNNQNGTEKSLVCAVSLDFHKFISAVHYFTFNSRTI